MRGVIVIIAFVLCGCAAEVATTQWTRPTGLAHDLPVDLYICEQWSRLPGSSNGLHMVALHDCMAARGWQETAAAR
jgi:hypothetical protein